MKRVGRNGWEENRNFISHFPFDKKKEGQWYLIEYFLFHL